MGIENDLYTDYALQLFSSYMSEDANTMHSVLESFKQDNKNFDNLFMPGLIYGLMYHMGTFIRIVSEQTDNPVKSLLSNYAIDYAIAREDLLDNPLLNVSKARESFETLIEELKKIEDLDFWLDSDSE